jgi:integrase
VFRWKTAEGFKAVWTRWLARARRTALLDKLRTELDSIGLDGEAQARALQWHKREPDPRAVALWEQLQSDPFLDNLHFHDLRHEVTSRLFEKGLGIMEVASMTGHKSLSMLKRYTHIEAEKLAKKLG